jgi:hypothetical protein
MVILRQNPYQDENTSKRPFSVVREVNMRSNEAKNVRFFSAILGKNAQLTRSTLLGDKQ